MEYAEVDSVHSVNMIIWWFGEGDDDEDEESNYEVDIQKVKFDSGIWLKLFVLAAWPTHWSSPIIDDDLDVVMIGDYTGLWWWSSTK